MQSVFEEKFKNWHELYVTDVFRYLLYLSKNEEQALDLQQEVFMRFWQYYAGKSIVNPKGLLLKIARNSFFKSSREYHNADVELSEGILAVRTDTGKSAGEEWHQLKADVLNFLSSKKEILGDIFTLRIDHNCNQEEIAEILGVSDRTVRRYIEQMRQLIQQQYL